MFDLGLSIDSFVVDLLDCYYMGMRVCLHSMGALSI